MSNLIAGRASVTVESFSGPSSVKDEHGSSSGQVGSFQGMPIKDMTEAENEAAHGSIKGAVQRMMPTLQPERVEASPIEIQESEHPLGHEVKDVTNRAGGDNPVDNRAVGGLRARLKQAAQQVGGVALQARNIVADTAGAMGAVFKPGAETIAADLKKAKEEFAKEEFAKEVNDGAGHIAGTIGSGLKETGKEIKDAAVASVVETKAAAGKFVAGKLRKAANALSPEEKPGPDAEPGGLIDQLRQGLEEIKGIAKVIEKPTAATAQTEGDTHAVERKPSGGKEPEKTRMPIE